MMMGSSCCGAIALLLIVAQYGAFFMSRAPCIAFAAPFPAPGPDADPAPGPGPDPGPFPYSAAFYESGGAEQSELHFEVAEGVPEGTLIGLISAPNLTESSASSSSSSNQDDSSSSESSPSPSIVQPPYLIVSIAGSVNRGSLSDLLRNSSSTSTVASSTSSSSSNHDRPDLIVDQSTGEIRSAIILDRERRSFYSFIIIPLSGPNIKVTVTVLDVNDHEPHFPVDVIQLDFPENSKPRDVKRALPPAKDQDVGINGVQQYRIISGNSGNMFRLLSHRERDDVLYLDLQVTGLLDRESVPFYTLVIEALDGGQPPLRAEMTVNVTVLDQNDNEPVFSQSRYFASVPENASIGTPVLKVEATDADAGENGVVKYSIYRKSLGPQGGTGDRKHDPDIQYFGIDEHTGWIHVLKELDYETNDVHELVVVARDSGAQALETTAFVSVKVTDVNDNGPTINLLFLTEGGSPRVPETAKVGDLVARVSVDDPDNPTSSQFDSDNSPLSGPNPASSKSSSASMPSGFLSSSSSSSSGSQSNSKRGFRVSLMGAEGHFGLTTQDSIVYLIVVTAPLHRELRTRYSLSIVATDYGDPPLTATKDFSIDVTEVNDGKPNLDDSSNTLASHASGGSLGIKTSSNGNLYAFEVPENTPSGSVIGLIPLPSHIAHKVTANRKCDQGFFIHFKSVNTEAQQNYISSQPGHDNDIWSDFPFVIDVSAGNQFSSKFWTSVQHTSYGTISHHSLGDQVPGFRLILSASLDHEKRRSIDFSIEIDTEQCIAFIHHSLNVISNSSSILLIKVNVMKVTVAPTVETVLESKAGGSSSSPAQVAQLQQLPGWLIFLVVLLVIITAILLVSLLVVSSHYGLLAAPFGGATSSHLGTLIRKFGSGVTAVTDDSNSTTCPHHGYCTAPPQPPTYQDITYSSGSGAALFERASASSSARGFADDEVIEVEGDLDDVDEEVRRINERAELYLEALDDDESELEEEHPGQISQAEYLARLGVKGYTDEDDEDMLDGHGHVMRVDHEEGHDMVLDDLASVQLAHRTAPLFSSSRSHGSRSQRRAKQRRGRSDQDAMTVCGSMTCMIQSEDEVGNQLDYLQHWAPKYQPLSHVFAEIARIKSGTLSESESIRGHTLSAHRPYKGPKRGRGANDHIYDMNDSQAQLMETCSTISRGSVRTFASGHHRPRKSHHHNLRSNRSSPTGLTVGSAFTPVVSRSSRKSAPNSNPLVRSGADGIRGIVGLPTNPLPPPPPMSLPPHHQHSTPSSHHGHHSSHDHHVNTNLTDKHTYINDVEVRI